MMLLMFVSSLEDFLCLHRGAALDALMHEDSAPQSRWVYAELCCAAGCALIKGLLWGFNYYYFLCP